MRVAVIGGGPSGLTTLKYLLSAHKFLGCDEVEARLFEYQPTVGGTFAARVYEDAELVSSKQLTTFSDFRYNSNDDFLSAEQYVQYLQEYAAHFKLWQHIHLNTRVVSVRRRGRGHTVAYKASDGARLEEWDCDAVAVCSGLHVKPNIPHIEGIQSVPTVLHSSDFKARSQFGTDKTVMIVGSGETGSDVAYLAITSPTKRVLFCHRDGCHFAPKRNGGPTVLPILGRKPDPARPGIPIDVSRANLFDTTYVPPILRNSMLLWEYYNYYVKGLLWISSGTMHGMDQWIGGISPERHHVSKIFFNKSLRVSPYISGPYKPKKSELYYWVNRVRSAFVQFPIPETNGRHVDLSPWPESFDSSGVVKFRNNGRLEYDRLKDEKIRPDIVVLCTGYEQTFPFFETESDLDPATRSYKPPSAANVRGIWNREDPTVGFIGFLRPSLGAIPPLAEMQAQLWTLNLLAPKKLATSLRPDQEPHYRIMHPPGSRITYGVDHESYAYQLALDLQCAPGITDIIKLMSHHGLFKAWRLLVIWAFGAHFNTKFRLKGAWKWDGASDLLVSDEFWETITRRPVLFGHIAVSLVPMAIFGPLSLLVWFYSLVMGFPL